MASFGGVKVDLGQAKIAGSQTVRGIGTDVDVDSYVPGMMNPSAPNTYFRGVQYTEPQTEVPLSVFNDNEVAYLALKTSSGEIFVFERYGPDTIRVRYRTRERRPEGHGGDEYIDTSCTFPEQINSLENIIVGEPAKLNGKFGSFETGRFAVEQVTVVFENINSPRVGISRSSIFSDFSDGIGKEPSQSNIPISTRR